MNAKEIVLQTEKKMQKTIESAKREFAEVRTGRAHPGLIEGMHIDYAGTPMMIKQVAAISIPDPKTVLIQPWDVSIISEKLASGNSDHELKGLIIGNKKYAFELIACDEKTKGCIFNVNGIQSDMIYLSHDGKSSDSFSLNDEYEFRIESIVFNFCDHKRFCDTYFEAYDWVNISIERKKRGDKG